MRLTPGLEDVDITLTPAQAAPYTILMAPSSLSACTNVRPSSGIRFERYSRISVCGVIG